MTETMLAVPCGECEGYPAEFANTCETCGGRRRIEIISRRRRTCPECGSKLSAISYGFPAGPPPEGVVLGGCVITNNAPSHRCQHCQRSYIREQAVNRLLSG